MCEKSPLQVYKKVATLRKENAFKNAQLEYSVVNENVLSYVRKDEETTYLVALNLGDEASVDDYAHNLSEDAPTTGVVVVDSGGVSEDIESGKFVDLRNIKLESGDGLIIKLEKKNLDKTEL